MKLARIVMLAVTVTLAAALAASPAEARERSHGGKPGSIAVGIGLGSLNSLEFGYWLTDKQWVTVGLGAQLYRGWAGGFAADVGFHQRLADIETTDKNIALPIHVGGAAILGAYSYNVPYYCTATWRYCGMQSQTEAVLGLYLPVGLDLWFKKAPLSLFLEAGPMLTLTQGLWFWWIGQVGVRFHFDVAK